MFNVKKGDPERIHALNIQRKINQINATPTIAEDGILGQLTRKATKFLSQQFGVGSELSDLEHFLEMKHLSMLDVPYLTQRVDYQYAGRMCNIACLLMVSNYYNENGVIDPRSIEQLDHKIDSSQSLKDWAIKSGLRSFVNRQRLEQLSSVIARVLSDKTGQDFIFDYISRDQIDTLLQKKDPIIVSTQLIGFLTKKTGTGHYIVIIGRANSGYIINDPWGFYGDGYSKSQIGDIQRKGEEVIVPASVLFGEFGIKTEKHDSGYGASDLYRSIFVKKSGSKLFL